MSIRRILVAIDATGADVTALDALAALAARLSAELMGLFVEDSNLLRAAGLPFTREVGFPSASSRAIAPEGLLRALRARARAAEQAIATVAGQAKARWSFRTARGLVPQELLDAAAAADLVVVERASRPGRPSRLLGSTVREVLDRVAGSVLLLHPRTGLRPPVVGWLDDPKDARDLLPVLVGLADPLGDHAPVVQLAGGSEAAVRDLAASCAAVVAATGGRIRVEPLATPAAVQRAQAAVPAAAGVLIVSRCSGWLRSGGVQALAELPCTVLLAAARADGPPPG